MIDPSGPPVEPLWIPAPDEIREAWQEGPNLLPPPDDDEAVPGLPPWPEDTDG